MSKLHFYVLEPDGGIAYGTKWAYAEQADPVRMGEAKICPVCGRPVTLLAWLPPHRIRLSSAKPGKWGDFLWGGTFLMVAERVKQAYEAEGLTGVEEFAPPAEIVRVGTRKTGDIPPGIPPYHLINIVWNGANQDDIRSGVLHRRPEDMKCWYCRSDVTVRRQEAVILEEGSWTGADIFRPRGAPVPVMVSERFKQVAEAYHFTNCWMIPSEKYVYDEQLSDEHGMRLWYVRE